MFSLICGESVYCIVWEHLLLWEACPWNISRPAHIHPLLPPPPAPPGPPPPPSWPLLPYIPLCRVKTRLLTLISKELDSTQGMGGRGWAGEKVGKGGRGRKPTILLMCPTKQRSKIYVIFRDGVDSTGSTTHRWCRKDTTGTVDDVGSSVQCKHQKDSIQ